MPGLLLKFDGVNMVYTNNIVYHVSGGWGIAPGTNGGIVANNLVFENSNGGSYLSPGSGSANRRK